MPLVRHFSIVPSCCRKRWVYYIQQLFVLISYITIKSICTIRVENYFFNFLNRFETASVHWKRTVWNTVWNVYVFIIYHLFPLVIFLNRIDLVRITIYRNLYLLFYNPYKTAYDVTAVSYTHLANRTDDNTEYRLTRQNKCNFVSTV